MARLLAHDLKDDKVERTSDVLETSKMTFADFQLPEKILHGLTTAGFLRPSPIQVQSIPVLKLGLDMIIQAKSGTGKTLVFTLAALLAIEEEENIEDCANIEIKAMILTPTREVAVQANRAINEIGANIANVKARSFIGGMSYEEDIFKVRRCNVVYGTPGRIRQLIQEGHLNPERLKLFVLDEADKLMGPSFLKDVQWIFKFMPISKQVIACSATYPDELAKVVETLMKNPSHVRLAQKDQVLQGIQQYVYPIKRHPNPKFQTKLKEKAVLRILEATSFSQCLLFSNYSLRAEHFCQVAEEQGWPALFMSSAKDQKQRLQAVGKLKQYQTRLLFSTDVIARGIDAQNVDLVINIDVPWKCSTYLHRIGRGGRFGTRALAVSLAIEGEEMENLRDIVFQTGSKIRALPSFQNWSKEFDLWSLEEDLETLEAKESANPKLFQDGNHQLLNGDDGTPRWEKKLREKDACPVTEEIEEPIDITKAWIPVMKKPSYDEAKEILSSHFEEHDEPNNETKMKQMKEIEADVDEFLAVNWGSELESEMSNKLHFSDEFHDAIEVIIDTETQKFQEKFEKARKFFRGMSTRDGIEFLQTVGKIEELEEEEEEKEEEDIHQYYEEGPDYTNYADQEFFKEEYFKANDRAEKFTDVQSEIFNLKDLNHLNFEQKGEFNTSKFCDYPLLHPNPNRLIPDCVDFKDTRWLSQWFREVEENKEFIHDMALLKQMKNKFQ